MFKHFSFFLTKISKKFKSGIVSASGRNFLGRVCVQHQGGLCKNNYIKIDRFRYINKYGLILRVLNHFFFSGFIGLIVYSNGLVNFILLSEGIKKGYNIFSGRQKNKVFVGSTQKLLNIKLFDSINSIENFPFSGAKLARAAGVFSNIFSKENEKSVLKLSSG
jgi:large subunit ribosomal protein L2